MQSPIEGPGLVTASSAAEIKDYFVCIGAQKAGTTWLGRVLGRHPEIFFAPVKEVHYFDHVRGITGHLSDSKRRSRLRKHYQRLLTQWGRLAELKAQNAWYARYMADPIDDRWYASLFTDRLGRCFAGEATPEYAILGVEGLAHIKRLAPSARVIFIMRNPVRHAWSRLLHQCRVRRLDARQLDERAMHAILAEERMRALGNFPATLDDLAHVFDRTQVLKLFYEDIHRDRLAALEQVSAFIGAGFTASALPRLDARHNRSQDVALPETLRKYLQTSTREIAVATGDRVGSLPASWCAEYGL
jgi:hypothetical protein